MNKKISVLPPYVKLAIGVSIVGVSLFIAYRVYKAIKDAKDSQNIKDTLKENDKEIKTLLNKGESTTKPLSVYNTTANTIEQKLSGCENVNTEVDVIKLITQVVKKPIDWNVLVKAFGKRKIDDCGIPPFSGDTDYELPTLLKDQLDQTYNMKVIGDGFVYDGTRSGSKRTSDILNIYLKKIGVQI